MKLLRRYMYEYKALEYASKLKREDYVSIKVVEKPTAKQNKPYKRKEIIVK